MNTMTRPVTPKPMSPQKTADKIDRGQAVEVKIMGPRIFQRKERPERSPEDENKTPKEY